jgi:hypothetical protein
MKAYMSSRESRPIAGCFLKAMVETERILADTEPGDRGISGYGTSTAQFGIDRIAHSFPCEPLDALTMGLAWFIALDIKGDIEGLRYGS